jgi:ribosomal protein S18 acetylase RimI-like enzyme
MAGQSTAFIPGPLRWIPDPETLFVRTMSATRPSGSDVTVRDAVVADASAIARIGRAAVPETYKDLIDDDSVLRAIVEQSYSLSALEACIARCACTEGAEFLVAEQGTSAVGFLHYDSEGPEPELHRIYVDPALKRRGIGTALIQELHARLAPGASYTLMVVADNRPAVSFYEQHGLVETRRLDGVAYMHEHMGVVFPPGTSEVAALMLRFQKAEEGRGERR